MRALLDLKGLNVVNFLIKVVKKLLKINKHRFAYSLRQVPAVSGE